MVHGYCEKLDSVCICPMTIEDSEKYRVIRNLPESRQWFFNSKTISPEQQEKWFINSLKEEKTLMFSIYSENLFAGGCSLYNIDRNDMSAEFGRIVITPGLCGSGIGYKAIKCVLNIAVRMNLYHVYLFVIKDNHSAIRCYKKAGFAPSISNDESKDMKMEICLK